MEGRHHWYLKRDRPRGQHHPHQGRGRRGPRRLPPLGGCLQPRVQGRPHRYLLRHRRPEGDRGPLLHRGHVRGRQRRPRCNVMNIDADKFLVEGADGGRRHPARRQGRQACKGDEADDYPLDIDEVCGIGRRIRSPASTCSWPRTLAPDATPAGLHVRRRRARPRGQPQQPGRGHGGGLHRAHPHRHGDHRGDGPAGAPPEQRTHRNHQLGRGIAPPAAGLVRRA